MMGTWEHQIPSAKLMSTFADFDSWGIPGGWQLGCQKKLTLSPNRNMASEYERNASVEFGIRQDLGYPMNPQIRSFLESKKP